MLKKKNLTAFVLAAFMTVGIFGTAVVSAHPNSNQPAAHHDQAPPHHHWENGHWVPNHK